MKKNYLMIIFLLVFNSLSTMSQSIKDIDGDKVYKFKYGKQIDRCTVEGEPIKDPNDRVIQVLAEKGTEIKVDKIINDEIVFTFLRWKGTSASVKKLNTKYFKGANNERKYFKLSKSVFLESIKLVEPKVLLEFGTATIPIKIRPGDGEDIPLDFYGNFNAGLGVSVKIRKFVNIYGGISLTSVPVDSITTKGIITSPTNASALTPTFGIIKEIGRVQLGGFVGWDFLSRELGKNWIYQGRPWYGIGIGFNIFTINRDSKTDDTQG